MKMRNSDTARCHFSQEPTKVGSPSLTAIDAPADATAPGMIFLTHHVY